MQVRHCKLSGLNNLPILLHLKAFNLQPTHLTVSIVMSRNVWERIFGFGVHTQLSRPAISYDFTSR